MKTFSDLDFTSIDYPFDGLGASLALGSHTISVLSGDSVGSYEVMVLNNNTADHDLLFWQSMSDVDSIMLSLQN